MEKNNVLHCCMQGGFFPPLLFPIYIKRLVWKGKKYMLYLKGISLSLIVRSVKLRSVTCRITVLTLFIKQ